MKPTRRWLLAVLPFALAACGGDEEVELEGDAGMEAAAPMDTAMGGMAGMDHGGAGVPTVVALQAVGGSNAGGQATVTGAGAETRIEVQLTGAGEGAHAGHIHSGTCDNIGPPVQPLQELTAGADGSGMVTTTVAIDPATVMNGQHSVQYHQSGAPNPGPGIACGTIPQHTM